LHLKYYSLHCISICARWAWFLLTLPDDLIPLYKQKYTTAQAISKVVASGKRISPGSSIPFEIARIYRLKKKKPKPKYVNDSRVRDVSALGEAGLRGRLVPAMREKILICYGSHLHYN